MRASNRQPNSPDHAQFALACAAANDLPAVWLRKETAEQLRALSAQALRAIPHRGLEIGGLLLGDLPAGDGQETIRVQEAPEIEIEHRSGPSFVLSDADLVAFRQALEACAGDSKRQVLGWWRSDTRGEAPQWHEEDAELTRQLFAERPAITLIARPQVSGPVEAVVFFADSGGVTASPAFPLPPESPATSMSASPKTAHSGFSQKDLEQTPDTERPWSGKAAAAWAWLTQARLQGRHLLRFGWTTLAAAAAVLALMALAPMLTSRFETRAPDRLAAVPPMPPSGHSVSSSPDTAESLGRNSLALLVEENGDALRIRWSGVPISDGQSTGKLLVDDGGSATIVDLSANDLAAGNMLYWPRSREVGLELRVDSAGQEQTVAYRVTRSAGASAPVQRQEPPKVRPDSSLARRSQQSGSRPPAAPRRPRERGQAASAGASSQTHRWDAGNSGEAGDSPGGATTIDAGGQEVAGATLSRKASPLAAPPAARAEEPACTKQFTTLSYYQPRGKLFFLGPLRKIPTLFRETKDTQQQEFLMPKPTLHSCPAIPLASRLASQRYVDLLVRIDAEGNVEKAEADGGDASPLHTEAASRVALGWKFRPGILGEKPVRTEMRVRILFPGESDPRGTEGQ